MVSILNIIQVKQLCDIGVSALRVCSVDCLNEVAKGKYRFGMFFTDFCKQGQLAYFVVFVAPEMLQLPPWKKVLSSRVYQDKLAVVAVDEAHCISEWLARLVYV